MFANRFNLFLLLILFLTTIIVKQIACVPMDKHSSIVDQSNRPSNLIESSSDNADPKPNGKHNDDDDSDEDIDYIKKIDREQKFKAQQQQHNDIESLSD